MADEEKELSQEELAKQWEEALKEQEQNQQTNPDEELAKQWEQALQQQASTPSDEDLAKQWEEALKEQQPTSSKEELSKQETPKEEISTDIDEKLKLLMDIPLEISVEIGNKLMSIDEILKISPNSVVELNRYINQPIDIKVNGKLIAKGQLYTVEGNFGVKITEIITPEERLKLIEEEM
ncbi:flagellar motor switch protein FliN [Venenivibrio stagnispumantis]|uniref:Flagellar motor switch protein FliN n=1 Tax=Venenivibrio stagnispumantis TaxID=407998 RepID=A0AA45WPZ4_9AQUI|nr:flagellar motor switch protein FliN [Venenivibrio stagnispumantis]MCW4572707.1 flagellar motor switch protein FliN [Venenivibrio stagnispumantis]SMP22790.1 flagellar motor switch protein FliN/FliY [Venenivibrio stagnispumantis]